jgi:DNA-binding CsgD family transcriptional regulator
MVHFGITPEKHAVVIEWALDQEAEKTLRRRVLRQMKGANQITTARRDIFTDAEWAETPAMRTMMAKAG